MRECPVCDGQNAETIHHIHYPLPTSFPLGSDQTIQLCKSCGMVFSDSGNSQADYDRYYHQSAKYVGGGTPSASESMRHQNTFNVLKDVMKSSPLICDLGCGAGNLLKKFHAEGFNNLTGLDNGNLGDQAEFKFIRTSVFSLKTNVHQKFDLVTCIGVFEHLREWPAAMSNILGLLNDDAWLYLEVPDASRYQDNVISPFQDFNLEHINHFSPQALSALLGQWGFEISHLQILQQPESSAYTMPVICLLARKTAPPTKPTLHFNPELKGHILAYIEKCQSLMNQFAQSLEKDLKGVDEVYIWGAGQLALKLSTLPVFKRVKIRNFLDQSVNVSHIGGIEVTRPDANLLPHIPILIGSTLHATSIKNDVQKLNLPNRVIMLG